MIFIERRVKYAEYKIDLISENNLSYQPMMSK